MKKGKVKNDTQDASVPLSDLLEDGVKASTEAGGTPSKKKHRREKDKKKKKKSKEKKKKRDHAHREESPERPSSKTKRKSAHFGALDNNEVETPDNVMRELVGEFGSLYDPCPFVGKGLKPDFDGLAVDWQPITYCNPPYDAISPWIDKAEKERDQRGCTTILFIPARTGTRYWENNIYGRASEIRFVTGKIMFKGYKRVSPHNMAFVIFKSQFEQEVERANSEWPLAQILAEKPVLRRGYGVLARVLDQALSEPSASYYQADGAAAWMTGIWSLETLLEAYDDNTLSPDIRTLLLPFFLQMISARQTKIPIQATLCSTTERHCLPELLRRSASQFAQSQELQNLINSSSRLEQATADDIAMLTTFYNAFAINARRCQLNASRQFYSKVSHDGEFVQHVMFMKE